MPEPKTFEHIRRSVRWLLMAMLLPILASVIAREALTYAQANGVTSSGQNGFVDTLLWVATAVTFLSLIPFYISVRSMLAARRDYDEGYIRLWAAITDEDNRRRYLELMGPEAFRKAGFKMPYTGRIFAPPVVKRTYSEMVYGKKETEL